MEFTANFTAIDFETATRRADSACQLAAVVVRDGSIVDKAKWMIRPQPLQFSRFNIEIHGITPDQVREEPVFGDLWPEIADKLGDDCLVAHNAKFDIGVLLACLRTHRQPIPDLHFTCTHAIARSTWPHLRRYGLKSLANWLGIRFQHHDALEDSIACAKILLAAGIDKQADSLEDLEKRLKLVRGKAGDWGYQGAQRRRRTRGDGSSQPADAGSQPADAGRTIVAEAALPFLTPDHTLAADGAAATGPEAEIDLQRLMIRAEFIRPLSGQQIAFAGRLRALTRAEAEALATRLGGKCQPAVDESTSLLVVGKPSVGKPSGRGQTGRGQGTVEEDLARQLCAQGAAIKIVDEQEFLGLVISPAQRAAT
jgi:DNA polymerase-3 subunit epsilon